MSFKKIKASNGYQLKSADITNVSNALEQSLNDDIIRKMMTTGNGFIGRESCRVVPNSGMVVRVQTGTGFQLDAAEVDTFDATFKPISVSANFNQTITSNVSGFTRYDRLCIKFNTNQDDEMASRQFRDITLTSVTLQNIAFSTKSTYTFLYVLGTPNAGIPAIPAGYVSLATITVVDSETEITADLIRDDRILLRPQDDMTRFVVFDGALSHSGDFSGGDGIQEAIDALPESGGEVLIRAGDYSPTYTINIPSGVRLVGEGSRTVINRPVGRNLLQAGQAALTAAIDLVSTEDATAEESPSVAFNSQDLEYLVAYLSGTNFVLRRISSITQALLGTEVVISANGASGNRINAVYVPSLNQYGVVYEDNADDIFLVTVSATGVVGTPVQVNTSANACAKPSVAYSTELSNTGFCVAYFDQTAKKVLFKRTGQAILEIATVNASTANGDVDVAYENNGECRVVFLEQDGTNELVKARRVDVSANALVGTVQTVFTSTDTNRCPRVAVGNEAGSECVGIIFINDTGATDNLKFRAMDDAADTFVAAAVNVGNAAGANRFCEICFNTDSNDFFMSWVNDTAGNADVMLASVDRTGTGVLAPTEITSNRTGATQPSVAYDSNIERVVTVWCDDDVSAGANSVYKYIYLLSEPAAAADRISLEGIKFLADSAQNLTLVDLKNSSYSSIKTCWFEEASGTGAIALEVGSDSDGVGVVGNFFVNNDTDIDDNGTNTADFGNVSV